MNTTVELAKRHVANGAALLLIALSLTACAGSGNLRDLPAGDVIEKPVVVPVTIDGALGDPMDPNSLAAQAPKRRVIYFDFDRADIQPEYLDLVAEHGRFLAAHPAARVRLEGHTDERGTREYNVALGERRAQSIERMLEYQGVDPAQLSSISYGEELPVDERHSPDAWALNRRVNILYDSEIPN